MAGEGGHHLEQTGEDELALKVGIGQSARRLGLPVPHVRVGVRSGDTTPQERRLTARLTDVAGAVTRAGMSAPVLFIIGRVVDLYDPAQLVPAALEVAEVAHA